MFKKKISFVFTPFLIFEGVVWSVITFFPKIYLKFVKKNEKNTEKNPEATSSLLLLLLNDILNLKDHFLSPKTWLVSCDWHFAPLPTPVIHFSKANSIFSARTTTEWFFYRCGLRRLNPWYVTNWENKAAGCCNFTGIISMDVFVCPFTGKCISLRARACARVCWGAWYSEFTFTNPIRLKL